MTAEAIIKFVADDDVVNTIIRGQHTNLAKGLLELVMNSVDSEARNCTLTFTRDGFKIIDDGKGFGSYDNVMVRFKRLGKAHTDDKPKFGRFGMGRGQIMPWGLIQWSSGEHRMTTDLNAFDGFRYEKGAKVDGCVVEGEFYETLPRYEFSRYLDDLVSQCRFIDSHIKIVVNNRTVNTADDEVWDEDTEDYRIRWQEGREVRGNIKVYNQGVFICNFPGYAEGLSGEVVAKKAMTLNMARNSIHPKDPIWERIRKRVNEKIKEHQQALQKRKTMTEDMRMPLIQALILPDRDMADMYLEDWKEHFALLPSRASRLPLLRDSRGRYHHFDTLNHRPLTKVPTGREREAEAISIQNLAVPLTLSELRTWGVETPEELIDRYNQRVAPCLWRFSHPEHPQHHYRHLLINARTIEFEIIAAAVDDSKTLVNNKELKPQEAAARNALEYASGVMAKRISNISGSKVPKRRIVLGESTHCDGWTDSASFIAVNRKMVSVLDRGQAGATQLALLLLHEYVHDENNPDCNEHGELFYERFHDLASNYTGNELIGSVARSIWGRYLTELNRKGIGLPKAAAGHPEADRAFVYRVTLGPAGLSDWAKVVLDKIGLQYTIRGQTLTLKSNIDFLYKREDVLSRWLHTQIPTELGHEFQAPTSSFDDDPETKEAIEEYWKQVADSWAEKSKGNPNSFMAARNAWAFRFGRRNPIERLLDFLIADPDTDVRHYESEPEVPMTEVTIGGPHFRFKLDRWEARGSFQYDQIIKFDGESVKNNSGAREAFVLSRVKNLLAGILDPVERANIVATLQSEGFGEELKGVASK